MQNETLEFIFSAVHPVMHPSYPATLRAFCNTQSNVWNNLIWFTPLTIYVPKKIHKLFDLNIFGPFAILVLIVLGFKFDYSETCNKRTPY